MLLSSVLHKCCWVSKALLIIIIAYIHQVCARPFPTHLTVISSPNLHLMKQMLVLTSCLQTSTSRPREATVSVPCHCSWVAWPGCDPPLSGSPPAVSGILPCCLPGVAAFTFCDVSLRKVWKHLLEGERWRMLRFECHLPAGRCPERAKPLPNRVPEFC